MKREEAATFVRSEKWVCFPQRRRSGPFSTFVFQKRIKLNVMKCHWFDISVLINKPRRCSWGIVGRNVWAKQRQAKLLKVTCVYVSLRLCLHEDHIFISLGFFFFSMCALASSVTVMDRFTWQGHICPSNKASWVISKQWAMKNWSSLFFVPLITGEHKNRMLFCMLLILDTGMTF